jgi:NADH:ubiquinone oxidoreductase subunit 2 (subunit N)
MMVFRAFLVAVFVVVAGYTLMVIANHGMNLLPVFFGDMARMTWPGQFNLDFMCMLLLSGLWVGWRHEFSGGGIALGLLAVFGGALFLSAYLLVESIRARGDSRTLLLGAARASRIA